MGQRFVVRAGEREVVVRGTAFRVGYRNSNLAVSCIRGKVAVAATKEPRQGQSATSEVGLPAGYTLEEEARDSEHPVQPRRLSDKQG